MINLFVRTQDGSLEEDEQDEIIEFLERFVNGDYENVEYKGGFVDEKILNTKFQPDFEEFYNKPFKKIEENISTHNMDIWRLRNEIINLFTKKDDNEINNQEVLDNLEIILNKYKIEYKNE